MLIIPAIDLKDGCVVRYVQGRLNKKVYSRSPLKTARQWVKSGAKLLHIVDLDGAFSGTPKNLKVVKRIVNELCAPLEFGGGVRSIEAIKKLLKLGIQRVVLGTRAAQDQKFLKKAAALFGKRIIVSVDARDNTVMTGGWKTSSEGADLLKFCRALAKMGFKQLIYTDTLKDGTLTGPNIKGIKKILKETGMEIIASGGVSCLNDLRKLKKLEKQGLAGVIIGKALYEGRFTLDEALKLS